MQPLIIEFSGIRLCNILPECAFSRKILNKYWGFGTASPADIDIYIKFKKGKKNPFKPVILKQGNNLIFSRGDFNCLLNLKSKKGFLEVTPQIQSFDSFLRTLYSWLLIQNNGLLLHSAGISNPITPRRCNGALFVGKSGAGKSTISKILQKSENKNVVAELALPKSHVISNISILSDELMPLRIINGKAKIYPSPFWGEMRNRGQRTEDRGQSVNLEKIVFLKKSERNQLNQISRGEFYKRMLACVMNFSKRTEDAQKVLKTVDMLADKIQYFELEFLKPGKKCVSASASGGVNPQIKKYINL